jgi:DNA-binding transcriptional ArsR family regulator
MSKTSEAIGSAPVFAALGDVTRLQLVARLSDGKPHSIAQLTAGLELTRQGVTKHLHVLQKAGVVTCKRVGRESRFVIRPAPIAKARDYLARASTQWDEAIERLRASLKK